MCSYLEQVEKIVGGKVKLEQAGGIYRVMMKGVEVARFSLQQLQGCCGVCVSYHANVSNPYRKKGLGALLNTMRQQIAWNARYTVLLCTDLEKNEPQQKILTKNKWQKLLTFKNRKTSNTVCIHALQLKDTGVKVGMKSADLMPPKASD